MARNELLFNKPVLAIGRLLCIIIKFAIHYISVFHSSDLYGKANKGQHAQPSMQYPGWVLTKHFAIILGVGEPYRSSDHNILY